jgi:Uma2 family endonuclease
MAKAWIQPLTAEEFFAQSFPDARTELVQGEVVRMSPAGFEHGVIALRLGARLLAFVEAHELGAVCGAETGFLIGRNPDTVRAPDVAFVARERLGEGPRVKTFLPFAPDLAVEVVSPSERAEGVQERVRDWFAGGVRQVWMVYPSVERVHVLRSPADVQILGGGETISGGDLLPGFSCPVAALFR